MVRRFLAPLRAFVLTHPRRKASPIKQVVAFRSSRRVFLFRLFVPFCARGGCDSCFPSSRQDLPVCASSASPRPPRHATIGCSGVVLCFFCPWKDGSSACVNDLIATTVKLSSQTGFSVNKTIWICQSFFSLVCDVCIWQLFVPLSQNRWMTFVCALHSAEAEK